MPYRVSDTIKKESDIMKKELVIVLAEDEPTTSRLYSDALRRVGYEVEVAFDGEEAIQKLEDTKEKPTLAILDILMPKMSGLDVLKYIKQNPKLQRVPVVMLTNVAEREDAEHALELGAVLYLTKIQYGPKEIVDKIGEIAAGYSSKPRDGAVPEVKTRVKDIGARG